MEKRVVESACNGVGGNSAAPTLGKGEIKRIGRCRDGRGKKGWIHKGRGRLKRRKTDVARKKGGHIRESGC